MTARADLDARQLISPRITPAARTLQFAQLESGKGSCFYLARLTAALLR